MPAAIGPELFARATDHCEGYVLPMARRCYAAAAAPETERAARRLIDALAERGAGQFASREAMCWGLAGMGTAKELAPVLAALAEGDALSQTPAVSGPAGGRPTKRFEVHPMLAARVQSRRAA